MHLSMYCPTYHPTGKRWGVWLINMPWIRGIWSIFIDNRGEIYVLWWGHLTLVFAPGERQLISHRSNPPLLPVGWYLGQYIDRCTSLPGHSQFFDVTSRKTGSSWGAWDTWSNATVLSAHRPALSSLSYPMITHTPLIAGNLTIKTLVARQPPTTTCMCRYSVGIHPPPLSIWNTTRKRCCRVHDLCGLTKHGHTGQSR